MEDRLRKLVEYVRDHPGTTTQEIASTLAVSDRTVRTWVHQANDALAGMAAITSSRGRHTLTIDDEEAFEQYFGHRSTIWSKVPQTTEERVASLLSNLLFRDGWVTIEALAQELYVTSRTISTELHVVEDTLSGYGLVLERKPYRGIRVSGPELSRRRCLATMIGTVVGPTRGVHSAGYAVIGHTNVHCLTLCLDETCERHDLSFSDAGYREMLIHLCISLGRAHAAWDEQLPEDEATRIEGGKEYAAARHLADGASVLTGIDLSSHEVAYLALCMASLGHYSKPSYDKGTPLGHDEALALAHEMVKAATKGSDWNLCDDDALMEDLAEQLIPLAVRMSYGIRLPDPLAKDVSEAYPDAVELARGSATAIAERIGATLPDEELTRLAIPFAIAFERVGAPRQEGNVLVVGPFGHMTTQLVELRYRRELQGIAHSVQACAISELEHQDLSSVDCVVTTVPLGAELASTVIEAPAFPGAQDVARIREALLKAPRERKRISSVN